MSDPRCGTYAGAQVHKRRGETPCPDCREASRHYQAHHRAKNVDRRRRDAAQGRAYNRAQAALRERHRDEFEHLYRAALGETMADCHSLEAT